MSPVRAAQREKISECRPYRALICYYILPRGLRPGYFLPPFQGSRAPCTLWVPLTNQPGATLFFLKELQTPHRTSARAEGLVFPLSSIGRPP